MRLPTPITLFLSSSLLACTLASPIPSNDSHLKLVRRMSLPIAGEEAGRSGAEIAENSRVVASSLEDAYEHSHFRSVSPDLHEETLGFGRSSPGHTKPTDPPKKPEKLPDSTSEKLPGHSWGIHSILRNLAQKLDRGAVALERKSFTARVYEATGLKALFKFIRSTARTLKSAGKRTGGLLVTGAKKTHTAAKFTTNLSAGLMVGGVLMVYRGVGDVVSLTARITSATARKAKELLFAAAKKAKNAAKVTATQTKKIAKQVGKTGKTVGIGLVKGILGPPYLAGLYSYKAARYLAISLSKTVNRSRFGVGKGLAKTGNKITKVGVKQMEKSIAKVEKTGGKPLRVPSWFEVNAKKAQDARSANIHEDVPGPAPQPSTASAEETPKRRSLRDHLDEAAREERESQGNSFASTSRGS